MDDFDDDFTLPPEMDADYSLPDRPLSPIQIDQEVTVKQKRKPAVKLFDRYPLLPIPFFSCI